MMKTRYYLSIFVFSLIATFVLVANTDAGYLYYEDFSGYADGEQPTGWIELTDADTVQNNEFDIDSYRDRVWYSGIRLPEKWEIEFDWNTGYGSSIWSTIQFAPDPEDLNSFVSIGPRGSNLMFAKGSGPENSGHVYGDRFVNPRSLDIEMESREWYTWKITYDGSAEGDGRLYVDIYDRDDGTLMGSVNSYYDVADYLDMDPLAGYFGFYNMSSGSMQIDNITIIPEPSALALLGLGGLLLLKRRRI